MKLTLLNSKTRIRLKDIEHELELSQAQRSDAALFINEVEKGNLNIDISKSLIESELGKTLLSLRKRLKTIEELENQRNWLNEGLAKFSDILRNKQSSLLQDLSSEILTNLVKYTDANQGGIFIIEGNEKDGEYLQMIACYAYDRRKYLNKRIEFGEGLAGQCVLERRTIYLKEIPRDYVNITSGLGDATPRSILITPLIINENIFGVLELASLAEFQQHHIDFIEKLAENIAASIKNVKDSERTLSLLNASQQQTEELRAQEEEMRQNVEEMQATQEEMQRKTNELNRSSAEMTGIIDGVNSTMATIEFTPDGTIIKANDNFLRSMKYTFSQIEGKHHRMFATKEILSSEDYKSFWTRLAAGTPITGVFKRISSDGQIVWLNAIYNPIRNAHQEVVKVIKFATDVTDEQEQVAETKGVLTGINATMATIEFQPDGTILTANDNFLKSLNVTLEGIKGKHHKIFAPKDEAASEDYKGFWTRLAAGHSVAGIFKRVSSTGSIVWLNAIYNPISNASGEIVKVIKFATDITEEQEKLAEGKGVLAGINATMATVEFLVDGTIIDANENFLKSMNYTTEKIKGKHHRMFVPTKVSESTDYIKFWSKLANGESQTGIFERITSDGKTVWLNAIYNPILNANGEIKKIIKFATDVTDAQEALSVIKEKKNKSIIADPIKISYVETPLL